MMKKILFLSMSVVILVAINQNFGAIPGTKQNPSVGNQAEVKKKTFLVIFKPGESWIAGKPLSAQPLKEHVTYWFYQYKAGVMRYAGPFEDGSGGAVMLEAADEIEAKNIVNKDPAVINRILTYEIHHWRLIPWDTLVRTDKK